jgi:type III restriction enzyme
MNYEEIMEGRRPFSPEVPSVPIADVKSPDLFALQEVFDYSAYLINKLRTEIRMWHEKVYLGVTKIQKELLDFWFRNPERISTHKLFFAQQEAVETASYINEVSPKENFGNFVLTELENTHTNEMPDPLNRFERIAFKIARKAPRSIR